VVITALAGDSLLQKLGLLDESGGPVDVRGLMAFTLVPFGLLLVVLLAWVRFVERRSTASIGLTGAHRVGSFLRGHAVGAVSILAIVAVIWLAGGFSTAAARAWSSPTALLSIAALLPCFALQSSVEELVFRGWLLSVLSKKFNVAVGVLLSSALFALVHLGRDQRPLVTVSNLLFGVFCCCWALRSRSVVGVMGWHSGWNWLLAVGFGLPLTGIDVGIPSVLAELTPAGADRLTGGAEGPEGSVVCVAYFLGGSAWLLRRRGPLRSS
jgi:membrane protease YdiL (CAAX protease family)